jgi:phage tail sheath gpL-like
VIGILAVAFLFALLHNVGAGAAIAALGMSVSFSQVPANLRVPVMTAEFDNSQAQSGPTALNYRGIMMGQMTSDGTATPDQTYRVTSAAQVGTLAGWGSQLHLMADAWFQANQTSEVWIGVLADDPSAVRAYGSLAVSGTATADGTVALYIGGRLITVAVAQGDTAATVASNLEQAIGRHDKGTVTLASPVAGTNVTVGTITFVGTTGAVTSGAATYSVDTSSSSAATSLAAQINANTTTNKLVQATASGAVVTLWKRPPGPALSVALATTDNVKAAVSGATLTGASPLAKLPATANLTASTTVQILARNAGLAGNDIDLRLNYAGESLPAGITIAVTGFANGTTNPSLANLLANMGDAWWQVNAHPYTDSASLTALENEGLSRAGPMRQIDMMSITTKNTNYSGLTTLGTSRNNQYSCIGTATLFPTTPWEIAANVAAVTLASITNDPAAPLTGLALVAVKPPALQDRFTLEERNLLLYDGVFTLRIGAGDQVQIERLITTYQQNQEGAADDSYLDANTLFTLSYLRFDWNNRLETKWNGFKLADDGTTFGPGQKIVTPKMLKADAFDWAEAMQEQGLIENVDVFQANLVVQRNATDKNRVDFLLPPDLVNQFLAGAGNIQFRL